MLYLWDVLAAVVNLPIAHAAFMAAVDHEIGRQVKQRRLALSSASTVATHFLDVDISQRSVAAGGADEQSALLMMSTVTLVKAATKIPSSRASAFGPEAVQDTSANAA